MTPEELSVASAAGQIEDVTPEPVPRAPAGATPLQDDQGLDDFLPLLVTLARPRIALTSPPTFIPKTFLDCFQMFDDGVDRRLYVYILAQSDKTHTTGTWRYSTLT